MDRVVKTNRQVVEGKERETGFEPATSTLARSHSTTELVPQSEPDHYREKAGSVQAGYDTGPPLSKSVTNQTVPWLPAGDLVYRDHVEAADGSLKLVSRDI